MGDYVCMSWDSDQQRIFCGTKAGELRVFDIRQRRVSQRVTAHDSAIRCSFVLPGRQKLLTVSVAAEVKLWSLSDLEYVETRGHLHTLRGVGSVLGKKALTCA